MESIKEDFLFICGVEGMGHQLMLDVLSEYLKGKENTNASNVVKNNAFRSASFPYGQPRNPYRRPNIALMKQNTPDNINLKFLILYRDPRYAAYSGYKRGFTNDIIEQCNIVDINLRYIREEMLKLHEDQYEIIRFEKFVENPSRYLETLSAFLNINKEILKEGFKKIKKPNFSLGDKEEVLNNYFKDKNYGF